MKRSDPLDSKAVVAVATGSRLDSHWLMMALSILSIVLLSLIFAPLSVWPVAFFCLVPWLIFVGKSDRAPRVYFHSYLLALGFFLFNMRWMYCATGVGYFALSLYQAVYFPFVAIVLRHAVRRRRWPLAIVLPIAWTGCEMLRAVVVSGFPWFFLSHGMHKALTFIQVADLVGAYGVTFVVAAVNGAFADFILARPEDNRGTWDWRGQLRRSRVSVIFAGLLLFASAVYGQIQLRRSTTSAGPKIAVIQGDFRNTVGPAGFTGVVGWAYDRLNEIYLYPDQPHDSASEAEKMELYLSLMQAASEHKPDLYLLPESAWIMYLNPEVRDLFPLSRQSFSALQNFARQQNSVVVAGSASVVPTPSDLLAKERRYNSATVFTPDGVEPKRYDKIHLVYFGEVVPFRFTRLHSLYLWFNRLMPFTGPEGQFEYSLFHGAGFSTFDMSAPSQDGKTYKFGTPICYEDVMPYVSREFVGGGSNVKQADFLVNISNDGWFGRGVQQPQHLSICVFRAVENRVGIARAVNTGMSGFIDPSGQIHDTVPIDQSGTGPGRCGFAVSNITVDSRFTIYSRYGDWFAWGCAFLWLLLFVDYWITRVRARVEE